MIRWHRDDFETMEKRFRTNFFNSLTGYKAATLIGTINAAEQTNLAIFSSVVHVGANPPLVGLVCRPTSVPRHTYQNIKAMGYYTINHIHHTFFEQAHHTAARYSAEVSEFEAAQLTPDYSDLHPAPYVVESPLKIGLQFVEEHEIAANGTIFVVGQVIETLLKPGSLCHDGFVDLEQSGIVTISGLDSYHRTETLARLPYAKPNG